MNEKGEKFKNMRNKTKTRLKKLGKTEKAITLIALVITIIILLILAGVSIATLTGENGILTRANEAKEQTGVAEEREMVELSAQAALIDNNGKEILEQHLNSELENAFGEYKYNLEKGENKGEEGFIVTITDTGRRYFVNKNGKVEQMIPGPKVTHTISPEEQVADGEKITITINATATEGEITKITKPDGTSVENTNTTTYEVEENGEYQFIVEQSNGGKITYAVEITNGKYVERFSDIYTSTQKYTKNGQTAWIPEGFAVGRTYGINNIENGLVITDKIDENHNSTGNEFVWVPVENFNEFTREHFGTEGQKWWTGTFVTDGLSANNMYELTSNGIKDNTEVEKMYKSVNDYGGFYVGRYEAGTTASSGTGIRGEVVSKKGANIYNSIGFADTDDMTDETGGAVEVARSMYTDKKGDSVTSTLIYGVQWDAIMRWMQEVPNLTGGKYIQDSTGMGWYSNNTNGNPNQTGIDLDEGKNKVKNIYDLAGNIIEWTMESFDTNNRVYRGGSCGNSGSSYPASSRHYSYPSYNGFRIGFRVALYL